jgi:hypothetical protein
MQGKHQTNVFHSLFSIQGDKNRINSAGPSPQNNLQRSNSMMGNDPTQFSPHPQGNNQQSNESNMQFPNDTPNMPFGPNVPQNSNKMPNFMDQKPGDVCPRHNHYFLHQFIFLTVILGSWTASISVVQWTTGKSAT